MLLPQRLRLPCNPTPRCLPWRGVTFLKATHECTTPAPRVIALAPGYLKTAPERHPRMAPWYPSPCCHAAKGSDAPMGLPLLSGAEAAKLASQLNSNIPVQVLDSKILLEAFLTVRQEELLYTSPEDREPGPATWQQKRKEGGNKPEAESYLTVSGKASKAVVILAISPHHQSLLVTLEYRHSASSYVLSLPGGAVDEWVTKTEVGDIQNEGVIKTESGTKSESILEAAQREFREETGCEVTALRVLGKSYALPGIWAQEVTFVSCVLDETKGPLEANIQRRGSEVLMKVFLMPLAEIALCCKSSVPTDGALLSGLWWLQHQN